MVAIAGIGGREVENGQFLFVLNVALAPHSVLQTKNCLREKPPFGNFSSTTSFDSPRSCSATLLVGLEARLLSLQLPAAAFLF